MNTRLNIEIDEETKKKLQIICIEKDITLKELITELINKYIADNK